MLAFFRSMAKSKFLAVLLFLPLMAGLLAIGNVRTDLEGLFNPSDAVVRAGSRTLNSADFKAAFDTYRNQLQQQGQTLTPQDAVTAGIDQQMLKALAGDESLAETLKRAGVWPSDKLVGDQVAQIKQFQNPITGKFDQAVYAKTLADNNMTSDQFLKRATREIATSLFSTAAAAGMKPPRLYGAVIGAYTYEQHALSIVAVDPRTLGTNASPTDADLMQLMKEHATALTVPETRTLTVVKFSAADLAKTATADPAEVKKRFDFRKDTLSSPETRSVVQVSVKDQATAAAVSGKLKAGADPAAVAQGVGAQTPLTYTDYTKSAIADSKVADAAFALPAGSVSGPIQGTLGWAVIKVTKVTPAKVVTFDEARPQIEQEVRTEAAAKSAYAQVKAYQTAHDKGSALAEAAKAAGATPQTFAPATASGIGADANPVQGLTARMLKEAFALPQGGETDAVQESKGEYFAVRVEKVIPPALPSLDAVRPRLAQAFIQQDMSKRLEAKLKDITARVKKGESMDEVAKSVGAQVVHLSVNRFQVQQNPSLQGQAAQIFGAKVGEVFSTGAAVAKVESIGPPPAGIIASAMPTGEMTMARGLFDEIQQESRDWASAKVKPKLNITLARQAIGVADSTSAAPAASGAAPARAQ